MTDIEAKIEQLQICYNKLTGIALTHRGVCNPRGPAWQRFIAAGFTVGELEFVILWLKSQVRIEKRNQGCLRFSNLIEDHYVFEEELGLAKAQARNAKAPQSNHAQAMAQLRPQATVDAPQAKPDSAKSIGDWMEKLRQSVERRD